MFLILAGNKVLMGKPTNQSKAVYPGFTIIEIVIVVLVVTVALVSLIELYNLFLKAEHHSAKYVQATFLAQEALEAVRNIRDTGWANISGLEFGTTYHPVAAGDPRTWSMAPGQETIDGFRREVVFERVYRDANDNIVESGGTEDVGSRKVIATVEWEEAGRIQNVHLITYLMNWRD